MFRRRVGSKGYRPFNNESRCCLLPLAGEVVTKPRTDDCVDFRTHPVLTIVRHEHVPRLRGGEHGFYAFRCGEGHRGIVATMGMKNIDLVATQLLRVHFQLRLRVITGGEHDKRAYFVGMPGSHHRCVEPSLREPHHDRLFIVHGKIPPRFLERGEIPIGRRFHHFRSHLGRRGYIIRCRREAQGVVGNRLPDLRVRGLGTYESHIRHLQGLRPPQHQFRCLSVSVEEQHGVQSAQGIRPHTVHPRIGSPRNVTRAHSGCFHGRHIHTIPSVSLLDAEIRGKERVPLRIGLGLLHKLPPSFHGPKRSKRRFRLKVAGIGASSRNSLSQDFHRPFGIAVPHQRQSETRIRRRIRRNSGYPDVVELNSAPIVPGSLRRLRPFPRTSKIVSSKLRHSDFRRQRNDDKEKQ